MSIYEKIDRLFVERGTSVYKEAEKLNFGPVNLAILAGDMEYVKVNAPEMKNISLPSCSIVVLMSSWRELIKTVQSSHHLR